MHNGSGTLASVSTALSDTGGAVYLVVFVVVVVFRSVGSARLDTNSELSLNAWLKSRRKVGKQTF